MFYSYFGSDFVSRNLCFHRLILGFDLGSVAFGAFVILEVAEDASAAFWMDSLRMLLKGLPREDWR